MFLIAFAISVLGAASYAAFVTDVDTPQRKKLRATEDPLRFRKHVQNQAFFGLVKDVVPQKISTLDTEILELDKKIESSWS